ncbi:MAG: SprB repeat-containing protein [Flavobacteriales bacterium]|nr:SprB repeat-containing protein [Flavobacteriales bacterium]
MPYTFDWRGPDSSSFNTEDIPTLIAGEYTLVVTDANSCASAVSITLTEPDSTVIDATLSQYNGGFNTTCDGSSDGSISVVVSGGSPDHSLTWSGPNGFSSTNDTITSLISGTYALSITDLNGCVSSTDVFLQSPTPISPIPIGRYIPKRNQHQLYRGERWIDT